MTRHAQNLLEITLYYQFSSTSTMPSKAENTMQLLRHTYAWNVCIFIKCLVESDPKNIPIILCFIRLNQTLNIKHLYVLIVVYYFQLYMTWYWYFYYNNIALFLTHITLAPTQWKECKFFLIRLYIFKNRCLPDRLIKFLYLHTFCNVNYCLLKMSQIIRILGDFFFRQKIYGNVIKCVASHSHTFYGK